MTFWQVRWLWDKTVSVVSVWLCSLPLMGFGDARNVSVGEAKGTCYRRTCHRFSNFPIGIPQGLECAMRVWCHKLRVFITSDSRMARRGCHEHRGVQTQYRPWPTMTEILTLQIMWSTVLSILHSLFFPELSFPSFPDWEYVCTIPFVISIYSDVFSHSASR